MRLLLLATLLTTNLAHGYDPMQAAAPSTLVDSSLMDPARNRDIPLRFYLPAEKKMGPVVLFSHGLGGSRQGSAYLGRHWAASGYVAVFLQHPGSDDSLWKDKPMAQRLAAVKAGGSLANFKLRVEDIVAVLDALPGWHTDPKHPLVGRLDVQKVGMSGHSFGAITTQAVAGQKAGRFDFTDKRIRAAIPMSPSLPRLGTPAEAFGQVAVPWLLMTGTHDVAIVADFTPESRLQLFPALPAGGKYELVLNGAEHSAFTETPLPGDSQPRNPNHHRAILALSTAFWDANLRGNAEAKAWLEAEGARAVLEKADTWRWK
jgi:predicted dienelactone hydrolase